MKNYPSRFYMNSGMGISKHQMVAFDNALISAGISNFNLVRISSILPEGAVREEKVDLREGTALLTAYARIDSNVVGTRIATAVGVAIPANPNTIGIIMEYSGYCSASEAEQQIKDMLSEAMQNHDIHYIEILTSSIDAVVIEPNTYTSLISAIAIW